MVDVNGAGIAVDAPFGGYKHSGIGREAGAEGQLSFQKLKLLVVGIKIQLKSELITVIFTS